MTSLRKLTSVFLCLMISLFSLSPVIVSAQDLVITGNGEGSTSEVKIETTQVTSIEQTNNSSVDNEVKLDSNTGSNQTESGAGSSDINTGDIDTKVDVENNLNYSAIDSCCIEHPTNQVEIKANGSGSTNKIDIALNRDTKIDINQKADIDNHVSGSANTGENKVKDNNGDVNIQTGSIFVESKIKNGNINTSKVTGGESDPGVSVSISENGTDSQNLVTLLLNDLANINVNNNANLKNYSNWDLNTGKNEVEGTSGKVSIKTGDIFLNLLIENRANENILDWGCCKSKTPPPPPPGDGGHNDPPPGANPPPNSQPRSLSEVLGINKPGPAVLGLSFTGGLFDNPLIFWTGLFMLTFGLAILGRSLPSIKPSRYET